MRPDASGGYALLLACRRSGQMPASDWQAHLRNSHFAAWVRRQPG